MNKNEFIEIAKEFKVLRNITNSVVAFAVKFIHNNDREKCNCLEEYSGQQLIWGEFSHQMDEVEVELFSEPFDKLFYNPIPGFNPMDDNLYKKINKDEGVTNAVECREVIRTFKARLASFFKRIRELDYLGDRRDRIYEGVVEVENWFTNVWDMIDAI